MTTSDTIDVQDLSLLKIKIEQLKSEIIKIESTLSNYEHKEKNTVNLTDVYIFGRNLGPEASLSGCTYNTKDTIENKIIYVLGKIGYGGADDIADYLLAIDKDIKDTRRVYTRITIVAYSMLKNGIIAQQAIGKKTVYKLV